MPSYRDPYSYSGLHTLHISGGPRRLMLKNMADHLQSLGGGSMRLHSNGGSAMPSYADVSFQDPELGQVNARFRLATGLTMERMSTASGTDLTGHPQWEAMTRVRQVGSSNSGQNLAAGLPPGAAD